MEAERISNAFDYDPAKDKDDDDYAKGGEMARGGVFEVGRFYKAKDGKNYRFLGSKYFMGVDGQYKKLEVDDFYAKGGKIGDKFVEAYNYGDRVGYIRNLGNCEMEIKGKEKEIPLLVIAKVMNLYEATGDAEFEKKPYEVTFEAVPYPKYIDKKHIESALEGSGLEDDIKLDLNNLQYYGDIFEGYMSGIPIRNLEKRFETEEEAEDYIKSKKINSELTITGRMIGFLLDAPVNRIGTTGWQYLEHIVDESVDPYRFAKGGKTKEQGYDDREDESLAMRHGKISSKDFVGSHHKKEHSRRDDAHFETRDK
jgi:hypothetical protein